ncbi:hypothetical protein F4776DRAFT_597067 [Hypoxylon sp. NC0597]|nr:hypothetical protein F4776DRAFT_597067 [Hypoxylon sp. NC0597]
MAKENDHKRLDSESNGQSRWPPDRPPQLNEVNLMTSQSATQGHLDTMSSPAFLGHPRTPSPLLTQFTMAMCRTLDSRPFLPQDQLNSLTPASVKEELKRALPNLPDSVLDNYTTRITGMLTTNNATNYGCSREPLLLGEHRVPKQRLVRTFAVLVLLDKVKSIPSFISEGFTDSLLPIDHAHFRGEPQSSLPSLVLLKRCFNNWTMADIAAFIKTQWGVLSPYLNKSKGDVSLYDFSAQTILPIFDSDTISNPCINVGGYSIVRKVKIHPGHHDFRDNQGQPYFALKQLRSQRIKDFQREVAALRPFAVSPHSHVVNLLAAFRHGASFYLLFPWAEGGNLRSFWRKNAKPTQDGPFLGWIAEQCLGIATALRQIHYGHYAEEEHYTTEKQKVKARRGVNPTHVSCHGLHGDVKPANILLFKEDPYSEEFVWTLSDFGLGKFCHPKGRHVAGDRAIGFSPTYRAPEVDIKGTIDESYDIWSLGCVLLEVLTWLLHGWEGVESFALSRAKSDNSGMKEGWRDDGFFILAVSRQGGMPKAELKRSVVLLIDNLSMDKAASPYIIDMLRLTRDYLLNTNWAKRASSLLVVEKLQCLRQRCLEDPAYTVALPWPRKPPWLNDEFNSLHKPYFQEFDYQTQPILANMAYIPSSRELNYSDPMPTPSEDIRWPDFDGQLNNNDTELFNTLLNGAGSMRNVASDHRPDLSSDYYPHYQLNHYTHDAHNSPILDQTLSTQCLPQNSNSRRRTLNDAISPDGIGEPRKKKARTKEELLTHDGLRKKSPETTSGQLPYATTKDALEPTGPTREERLFACPFHKRNPARYSTKAWKACIGPGWKISRLKEHIYRKHYVSGYRCDRCLSGFKNRSDLHQHSRADPPCDKRDFDADSDTIDESQKAQIQKKPRGVSDEQKWNEIYRIIFKLDSATEIPSPYCDTITGRADELADKKDDGDSLADFEAYLRRLADDGNQQDVSAITNCLDLVRRFQQSRTGEQSVTALDMPTLTYDCSDDATRTSGLQEFPSLTSIDDGVGVTNAEELNDLSYLDSSFAAHFDEVFSSDKTYCFPDSLDLGADDGRLPEG